MVQFQPRLPQTLVGIECPSKYQTCVLVSIKLDRPGCYVNFHGKISELTRLVNNEQRGC